MLEIIVFSKDRACQLELCLRSIKEKFNVDKKIYCQYTSTNEAFEMGFEKVAKMYPNVSFHKEVNFKETLSGLLKKVKSKYIVFFTDDDVFVKDVNEWCDFSLYHCLSLRMNPNINRCYPANNKEIKAPELIYNGDIWMEWNWTKAEDQHCCWGYPMAINSHVYQAYNSCTTKGIIPLIEQGRYHNVNSLEAWINRNRWFEQPIMVSFQETKVFNVQNNFVQGPRMNEQKYTVEWLNEQFLAGKRISTKNIYGLEPKAAHGVIDYIFE